MQAPKQEKQQGREQQCAQKEIQSPGDAVFAAAALAFEIANGFLI